MTRSTRVVIIHGAYGCPEENWFPWLSREVEALGCSALIPRFSTPEKQSFERWQEEFKAQVGEITPETILVGHSLGPLFMLRLLEKATEPVIASFLVAGFCEPLGNPVFDQINSSFFKATIDWHSVRAHAGQVFVYASDNDPYVPLSFGEKIAKHLSVNCTIVRGAGHFNTKAGYSEFPQLLHDLKRILVIK